MADILMAVHRVSDQMERFQRAGVPRTEPHDENQALLSDAFVLSIKSAAKPGITLET
jgi:hypothetical protein